MLVENNKLAQLGAKINLTEMGCEVDIVSTGQEALSITAQKIYDIVFMDIGLDEMDGFEVTKLIRNQIGKNSKTPIVALTAHADIDFKEQASKAGMDDFIVKPISIKTAQEIIEKYCYSKPGC